jgi:GntR family transcriptional repressor for pyruvate dehydrogenase complex
LGRSEEIASAPYQIVPQKSLDEEIDTMSGQGEPNELVPAYRSVANTIGERILGGEWPIGSGLPSETRLAQTLGVNRSTIREAIRVLEENGMLRRRPGGKRLFVSAPTDTEVATHVKTAMVLQEMSFLDLWEALHCIEPAITAAAALRISDAELHTPRRECESHTARCGLFRRFARTRL